MSLDRNDLRTLFQHELPRCPLVRAAWFGGSDATGRTDAESDVDLYVVVHPGDTSAYWERQQEWLQRLAPVRRCFILPEPTSHGAAQRFLQFEGLADEHMLDVCVLESLEPRVWLDPVRHGAAEVIHDPEGLLVLPEPDAAGLADRLASRRHELETVVPLFSHLVTKAVRRGRPLEALAFYHAMVLRPLVELLRICHCPGRHDFGMRYLERDLPADLHDRLLGLAFVPGATDLPSRCRDALALFHETLAAHPDILPEPAGAPPTECR